MITTLLVALLGMVIATAVGSFWYSGATPMGRIHMEAMGLGGLSAEEMKKKMEEAKPMMPKMYLGQMILSFLTSFAVVFVVITSIRNGVPTVMAVGFPVFSWLCFMVPVIGSGVLWSSSSKGSLAWKQFISDAGSNLVIVLLIALLATLFA